MEKDRTKKITMIVLIVAVMGLTVAFAALSQNLTINGSANVDAATWNIHFDNLSEAQISGEAKENSKPSINEDDKEKYRIYRLNSIGVIDISMDWITVAIINGSSTPKQLVKINNIGKKFLKIVLNFN